MRHHLAICKLQASKASQPPLWSLVNPFSTFRFFLSLSIGFFRFALGFSNRNLTEIYTELELKNSATYSLEGHAHNLFLFKYVDDTTVYEIVKKMGLVMRSPSMLRCLHGLLRTSSNWPPHKRNVLRITFARSPKNHKLVEIDGCKVNTVVKLLGFCIQEDLKWNSHVTEMTK